ncbi:MAG TPA: hypothetical protein VFW33_13680, partial [Gemmataceae bacterium]|nr:hypothetical protein [Gemmataceae bacterium]
GHAPTAAKRVSLLLVCLWRKQPSCRRATVMGADPYTTAEREQPQEVPIGETNRGLGGPRAAPSGDLFVT